MKKLLLVLLLLCLTCAFVSACTDDAGADGDPASELEENGAPGEYGPPRVEDLVIDVDLTGLSSTILSAEYHNIMTNADDYFGKRIKVSGNYMVMFYDPTDMYYHYVITMQADECCLEGFEFILSDDYIFPDDYPPENAMIEVIGIFSSYEESGQPYVHLIADHISF